jgi:hypothetical protein
MVELDCAGFTLLCLPVHSASFCIQKERIQVLLSRDQCWSIQELSSCALADSRGSFRSRSNSTSIHVYGLRLCRL